MVRWGTLRLCESECFQLLTEESCEFPGNLGLRHRRLLGLPPTDLPDTYAENVGESLLGVVTGRQPGGLESCIA
jgi:hypothetical protein